MQKEPQEKLTTRNDRHLGEKKVLHFEHSTSVVLKRRISVAEVCIQWRLHFFQIDFFVMVPFHSRRTNSGPFPSIDARTSRSAYVNGDFHAAKIKTIYTDLPFDIRNRNSAYETLRDFTGWK